MQHVKRVSRACSPCQKRKVRCNGQQRCQQCSHHGLDCTYAGPKKSGRVQGSRGRIISQCKQANNSDARLKTILPRHIDVVEATASQTVDRQYGTDFFRNLVPSYMASVYYTHPIVSEEEVRQCIESMGADDIAKAFAHAFAAATIHYTSAIVARQEGTYSHIRYLINTAATTLGPTMPGQQASVIVIMTYDFLATCSMGLQDSKTAFLYLRHAISLAETLRLSDDVSLLDARLTESLRQQRLYWLLYVHERYQSISEYRNSILRPLPRIPQYDNAVPAGIHVGFVRLVKLFMLLDDVFIDNWLSSRRDGKISPDWVISKCEDFYHDEEDCDSESQLLTVEQQADLTITRHWLLTLVWRMAMTNGLLGHFESETCLSLLFPVRICDRLRQAVTKVPHEAIEIHGAGIVQKLFELTDTMADVVLHVPPASMGDSAMRIDSLLFLLRLVFALPHLDVTRKGILGAKLDRLQSVT